MRSRVHIAIAALAAACASVPGADRVAHWRVFPLGETPAMTVTVSPRGRIIAKQGDETSVTILDGYAAKQVPLPEGVMGRVYESRSGQLWTTYSEGLVLFQRGQWTRFPVTEIKQEMERTIRRTRPLPLAPAEVNRIIFLTSDRLMEFDAISNRALSLKAVSETGLGQFTDMAELPEGGLLIAGRQGLARVQEALRRLNPSTPWEEFLLPAGTSIENLQRPFQTADGALMTIGFDRDRPDIRHLLLARADGWSDELIQEKIRLAWPGWADTRWAMSYNGIFRFARDRGLVRESGADTYFDVAAQTNGVFWVASSGGVIRYAPLLWRTPPELAAVGLTETPCLAMTQGQRQLWLATADGLIRANDGAVERFAWPDEFEAFLPLTETLFEAPNGNVVIGAGQRALLFEAASRAFRWLGADDEPVRALGILRDGSIALRVGGASAEARVERFDGTEMASLLPGLAPITNPADVLFAFETRAGDLWLGGAFGLARFQNGDRQGQLFGPAEGLAPERVQCMAEVGEEKLWAGGVDSIFELRGANWERVKSVERVRGIYRTREGAVWIASSDGLHQFKNGAWLAHGEEEGLPSMITHDVTLDRRGRLWAATSRGAVEYFPESDRDEPRTLPPTILDEQSDEPRGLTVRLAGVDKWNYTPPGRLLFAYRIDEGAWSPFTNVTLVSFENLSAGPHYIQARAMDRNGNQDPATATLEFTVTLPWSRDPRLIGVVILGLFAVAFFAALAVNRHWRLKRSYAEVEQIVAERTAQLEKANQELLHSQKMRALGTLAAGIAHDFNNILSVIKGSAQIIENNPGDKDKVLTRINRIQTVVDQGAGIVRSMLGLGKVGDLAECDSGELLEETIRVLGDRFPPEVHVRCERNGAAPRFTCSKGAMQQILLNLILNAIDASGGQGEVVLRARLTHQLGGGVALTPVEAPSYLAIDVVDHGSGIAPESLPRIFEPFYTTKGFSSRRGTGLGLSMVYELAKGLGYGLAVQSKLGEGSAFTVLAPLEKSVP